MTRWAAGRERAADAGVPAVEVRPVGPDDLDALTEIYLSSARYHAALDAAVYRVPDRPAVRDRIGRLIGDRGLAFEYLAAIVDEHVVGSVSIRRLAEPPAGSMIARVTTAEIGIAVLDGWRGRGIGAALMAAGERAAHDLGVERVVLDVSAANGDALRLYRRLGYREHGLLLSRRVSDGPA